MGEGLKRAIKAARATRQLKPRISLREQLAIEERGCMQAIDQRDELHQQVRKLSQIVTRLLSIHTNSDRMAEAQAVSLAEFREIETHIALMAGELEVEQTYRAVKEEK